MNFKNSSLLLAFAFSFFSFLTFAQNTHVVTGKVTDNDAGIPLEYATITFNDVTGKLSAQGGVTDFDGNFSIEIKEGTYNIVVEYISFQPKKYNNRTINKDINLGNIVLEINQNTLNEVVVRAETTEVDVRLDKKIYNIGKDLTTQGATVSDALSNVPSVTVDVEGGISLRGNENVRILINGKPSAMAGFGDTNIFQQLPADAIERVEVITSPSARYDAEGTAGILNIILRKEKTLGFNGSISANVGFPANSSISANLNLRTDKFNIFNTIGNYYRKSPGYGYFDSRYANAATDQDGIAYNREIEDRDMDRRYQGFNNNFGVEYFINDQSSITGSFFFRYGDDRDVTENNTIGYLNDEVSRRIYREQIEEEKDNSYQASLNYMNKFNDEGHQLTADFQYSYDKEDRPTTIVETKTFPTEDITDSESIFETEIQNEFLLQADYVLPMGEAQFEAGFRSNYEEEELDYELKEFGVLNDTLTNVFTYTENVNALYSQYGNKFGDFSFLLGLRLEQTIMKGELETLLPESTLEESLGVDFNANFDKNYLGLFPTVNLIYELSEDENITLGYNRRINRPRGWYINPFPSRSSATNVFQGNPDLDPAYSNFFDVGYLKKWEKLTLTSSVYYQKETNSFERIDEEIELNGRPGVRTIPINLGTDERIGAEIGTIYNPAKWLRLNASFNLFNSQTEGEYNGEEYGTENTTWFGRLSSKFELPAKIDLQLNGFYMGPRKNAQTENDGIFSANLAMSKEIVPNVLTASFNVSDLFNSRVRDSYTRLSNGTIRESEFQWRQRQYTLSVIYRFNQPNDRKKQREGQEENNGFGNGDENGGDY
ncbi:TonB-dependent receptor domain-containing protein [Mesonia sp. K7]|uniref:TonB-dependent receptor domain-containing protein n=1 Tax=Mesonia sp. K7 TaxID=2218606 RepID=UPI000DA88305|nr:TonB-dependent receptor [Mesonia sp. K7]PZD79339.1 TonB-dependent receptor [Mesonia sp. K7]